MAFRFPLVLPDRANRALLPAMLVAVLAAMALAQLLLTGDVALPEAGVVGGGSPRGALPDPGGVAVPPVIAARPIFAPRGAVGAAAGASTGGAIAAPVYRLGGAVIAGTVRIGRLIYAVVQGPRGRTVRMPIGGRINGWRLAGLSDTAAELARGSERLSVAYGSHPATPAPDAAAASGEEVPQ